MPPTEAELTVARSWIGNTETDDTFSERYDRLGGLDGAIVESLRAQLSVMILDQPSGLSTPDGLNLQYSENIRALRESLKNFIAIGGTPEDEAGPMGPGLVKMERVDYR